MSIDLLKGLAEAIQYREKETAFPHRRRAEARVVWRGALGYNKHDPEEVAFAERKLREIIVLELVGHDTCRRLNEALWAAKELENYLYREANPSPQLCCILEFLKDLRKAIDEALG